MKKHTILISFLTIVSLLLVACQLESKHSEAKIQGGPSVFQRGNYNQA